MTFTSDCVPTAVYAEPLNVTPEHVPPSRRQVQAAVESALLSGNGSLNRSNMTVSFPLNVVATEVQKAGAWSASGIGMRPVDCDVPGAAHCRSIITAMLLALSRFAKLTIDDR